MLGKILLVLVVVIVGAAVTLVAKPDIIGERNLLALAEWGASQGGVSLHFGSRPKLAIKSPGFLTKRVQFEANGICIHVAPDMADACFKVFRVDAEVKLKLGVPELRRIHDITIAEGRARVNTVSEWKAEADPEETAAADEPKKEPLQTVFEVLTNLKDFKVDKLNIGLRSVSVLTAESLIKGSASVDLLDPNSIAVKVDGLMEEREGAKKVTKAKGEVVLTHDESAKHPWKLTANANGLGYAADATVLAQLTEHSISAVVSAKASGGKLPVSYAALKECTVDWKGNESRSKTEFNLNCPVEAELADKFFMAENKKSGVNRRDIGWDRRASVVVGCALNTTDKEVKGGVSVKFAPVKTKLLSASADIDFEVQGTTAELVTFYQMPSKLQAKIEIPHFQRLVDWLDEAKWAIPGPLNALRGQITADINGGGRFLAGESKYPFEVKTTLASTEQKLDLDAKGAVLFQPTGVPARNVANARVKSERGMKTHLDLELSLAQVKLVLPPFDVTRPTRFFPDPRIEYTEPKEDEEPSSFSYKIHIFTPNAATLLSNLSKSPVPVNIDLTMESGKEMSGTISVSSFDANLFKKRATLEYFRLYMTGRKESAPRLDGRVKVEYTDYTILLGVKGTVDEPRLILDSDPPLPEEDVISVLLFGKPANELSTDEGDTAANTRAAVANRSISLASMYLLASTPIESVGFDPTTGAVQAKIRLDDKTSVTVKSDTKGGHRALGLRRRIGSFSIQTYIEDSETVQSEKTVSAMLEWSKRY